MESDPHAQTRSGHLHEDVRVRLPGLAADRLRGQRPVPPVRPAGRGRHVLDRATTRDLLPNDQDPVIHGGARRSRSTSPPGSGCALDGIIMGPPAFASDVIKIGDETEFGGPDFQVLGTLFFNFVRGAASLPPGDRQERDRRHAAADAGRSRRATASPVTPTVVPNVAEDRDGFEDEDGCPEQRQRQGRHQRSAGQVPAEARKLQRHRRRRRLPGGGHRRRRLPRLARQVPRRARDQERLPGRRRLPRRAAAGRSRSSPASSRASTSRPARPTSCPGSYAILDRAVVVLKEYPDIKLEIQGHTDNRGQGRLQPRPVASGAPNRSGPTSSPGHRRRSPDRGRLRPGPAHRRQLQRKRPLPQPPHRVQADHGALGGAALPSPLPSPAHAGEGKHAVGTRDAIRLTERIVRPRPRSGRG